MRMTAARHHPVVDIATADTIGRVGALGVAPTPAPPRIAVLRLGKTPDDRALLGWADLVAFGADAVTVQSSAALRAEQSDDPTHDQFDLLGKRALTESGSGLGAVMDAEFDTETGQLLEVHTDAGHVLEGAALIGLGDFAAVFTR
ncbi:MAG: PRC-barrel domain-containing protein [Sporichthyaceae bacterium]